MINRVVILLAFFFLVIFAIIPSLVFGEVPRSSPPVEFMNERAEGSGNFFEVKNSKYLNVNLTSTEEVKVFLESVPKIINLDIGADNNGINSAELTLKGLEPGKNYYQYQDSYRNKAVFVSDGQGNYTWTQDLAKPHHIWFQEAPIATQSVSFKSLAVTSMIFEDLGDLLGSTSPTDSAYLVPEDPVSEDLTPEDPTIIFLPDQCADYGTWDSGSSTCTLNQNLNQGVEITQDDFVLNCNNNTIENYGIYLFGRTDVTIKNCQITGDYSVFINNSSAITLDNNIITSQWEGAGSYYSTGTNIKNCKITSQQSDSVGFYYSTGGAVTNNIFSGEVQFYNSSNNNIENNTVTMGILGCVWFSDSDNNKITGNTFSCNNTEGLGFYNSNNNQTTGNTINANKWGVDVYSSSNDVFTDNNIKDNEYEGIGIYSSFSISFFDNNISNNGTGFGGYDSSDIKVYHNNFVDNHLGAETHDENIYFFDDGYTSGGNYWSNYSGVDSNGDGIGDTPYVFDSGKDNYPFMAKDGWVKPNKTPVLIVPGLMGTELKDGNELLWLDLGRMAKDIGDNFLDSLQFSTDLNAVNTSLLTGYIIESPLITQHFYDLLINEFRDQGYVENQDLFTFPYDWRYGVSGKFADGTTNSNLLAKKIQDIMTQTGSSKVDVIAHSLGGLIVKKYVVDHQADNHIRKAIFVGVPNTGAPKAVKGLLQGDNFGIPWLSQNEVKKISANMPSAYDLLPSQQYYNIAGSFVSLVDIGYGIGISEPTEKDLEYSEFKSYLNDKGLNSTAVVNSENLHTIDFDNFDLRTAGVNLYAINGCKSATPSNFLEVSYKDILGNRYTDYDSVSIKPGDNTVPLESATNLPIDQQNKYYALVSDHGKMPSQNGIRQEIVNLIAGSNLPIDSKIVTQDVSQCQLNGKAISVFSPVNIFVTDQNGNRLGLAADGSIINEIPNAGFEIMGEHKFIYLPQDNGQIYTINLSGTDAGTFTIKSQNISNSQIVGTEIFSNLPVTTELTGSVVINPSDNTTSLEIKQTLNAIQQTILPDSILTIEQANDNLPPNSMATLIGEKDEQGIYRGEVKAEIKSTDINSGVLAVQYNLDGAGFQKMPSDTVDLTILTEGKHTLIFFSTDKAGNNEQDKEIDFEIKFPSPQLVESKPVLTGGGGGNLFIANVPENKPVKLASRIAPEELNAIQDQLMQIKQALMALEAQNIISKPVVVQPTPEIAPEKNNEKKINPFVASMGNLKEVIMGFLNKFWVGLKKLKP